MFNINGLNVVDVIIIMIIALGAIIGLKEGVIKKLTSVLGLILVLVLAFTFKNELSAVFYDKLPFLHFGGLFKGLEVMNILFYEILAFVIIATVLMLVYKILIKVSKILEKILEATVIFAIPSKLLGLVVGLLEYYVITHLVLFVFTLPVFNIEEIAESKYAGKIINDTPIISKVTKETFELYDKIYDLVENRGKKSNEQINQEAMILMLDYDVLTKETAVKLIEEEKILVKNKNFLDKYN